MKKQIGFARDSQIVDTTRNYDGFYRFSLGNGDIIYGKILDETFKSLSLLPHLVSEKFGNGEGVVRLEESIPAEIAPGAVGIRQPISNDYIYSYLDRDSQKFEQGDGI